MMCYSIATITCFGHKIKLAYCLHEVLNITHWKFIINIVSYYIEFYDKEIHFNLIFIISKLSPVYSNPKLDSVWKEFVLIFNPKLQSTLLNKDTLMLINSAVKNFNVSISKLNDITKNIFFN